MLRGKDYHDRAHLHSVVKIDHVLVGHANATRRYSPTDIFWQSLRAVLVGSTHGTSHLDRRVKASPEEFREALRGRVTKHHRFLLRLHLNQIDALDAAMATLDAQVEANLGRTLGPFAPQSNS